jgi:hypothetical protein
LIKKYKFLKKKNLPDGIECSEGWLGILINMFQTISDNNPPEDFVFTKNKNISVKSVEEVLFANIIKISHLVKNVKEVVYVNIIKEGMIVKIAKVKEYVPIINLNKIVLRVIHLVLVLNVTWFM